MSLSWFIMFVLAVWRVTNILHTEKIFEPVRLKLGVDGFKVYNNISIQYLLSCFMCLSVWVGFLCYGAYLIYPPVLLPFAGSAGAILINHFIWGE
jgi:hypothetical protein